MARNNFTVGTDGRCPIYKEGHPKPHNAMAGTRPSKVARSRLARAPQGSNHYRQNVRVTTLEIFGSAQINIDNGRCLERDFS